MKELNMVVWDIGSMVDKIIIGSNEDERVWFPSIYNVRYGDDFRSVSINDNLYKKDNMEIKLDNDDSIYQVGIRAEQHNSDGLRHIR
ncbi:MAG: hypothetical protein ACOCRK_09920 [bacterium]